MAMMHVSLPDPMKIWIETRLKEGHFSDTSDYVRHLIRYDQEREAALAVLQKAIDQGIQSGEPERFDCEAFKTRMRERHVAQ